MRLVHTYATCPWASERVCERTSEQRVSIASGESDWACERTSERVTYRHMRRFGHIHVSVVMLEGIGKSFQDIFQRLSQIRPLSHPLKIAPATDGPRSQSLTDMRGRFWMTRERYSCVIKEEKSRKKWSLFKWSGSIVDSFCQQILYAMNDIENGRNTHWEWS